jgi:hypothetical protein
LDGVVLDDLVGPLAKLDSALVFDLEANGDDRLQAVVLNRSLNLTAAFGLND